MGSLIATSVLFGALPAAKAMRQAWKPVPASYNARKAYSSATVA